MITYSQSGSIHQLYQSQKLVITSGYLVQKFINQVGNSQIRFLNEHLKFGFEIHSKFVQLQLEIVTINSWISSKFQELFHDADLGVILYLTMVHKLVDCFPQNYSNRMIQQGEELYSISSPFGLQSPEMYRNSLRKAYTSIVLSNEGTQIIIIDMLTQIGQEGGSIYDRNGNYMGMIVPTVQILNNNRSYYSFALNWNSIQYLFSKQETIQKQLVSRQNIFNTLIQHSYQVYQGGKYGCGTLIFNEIHNQTYLLTVKHLLTSIVKGTIIEIGQNRLESRLIEDSQSDIDFALAQLDTPKEGIPISRLLYTEPYVGETVFIIGYASSIFRNEPIVIRGHIVNLVCDYDGNLVCLQTDCIVHNGYSGGGLFNEQGYLIGIVSFNIIEKHQGMVCDLSFCISIQLLRDVFQDLYEFGYLKTEKAQSIFKLKSKFLQNMNALQTRFEVPTIEYKPKL